MSRIKRHWTDPDYGISMVDTKGHALIRVNSLVKGKVKTINRVLTYFGHGGREATYRMAKRIRDEYLKNPEVIDYLNSVYVSPERKDILVRKHRTPSGNETVPGITGVYIEVRAKTLEDGTTTTYISAIGLAPKGGSEPGFVRFRRSLNKYGVSEALRIVAQWRAKMVSGDEPSEQALQAATQYVTKRFRDLLDPRQTHDLSPEFP